MSDAPQAPLAPVLEPTCTGCIYFRPTTSGGTCRRNPPVQTAGYVGNAAFPRVDGDDWCGEFKVVA